MKEISDDFLAKVRKYATRINSTSFDDEIKMYIEACRQDLILSGITEEKVYKEDDSLVTNAIFNYVRAEFGLDNKDSEKFRNSYHLILLKMCMSTDYTKKASVKDELGR